MYRYKIVILFLSLTGLLVDATPNQTTSATEDIDVSSYDLKLNVNMVKQSFTGSVGIDFLLNPESDKIVFDCGNLKITEVIGKDVLGFEQKNKKVIISLNSRKNKRNHVQITYSGGASHGLVFLPQSQEAYTVFATSEWMVCHETPSDRAKFKVELSIPKSVVGIASGALEKQSETVNKSKFLWVQEYETPAYTFGFAIGPFNKSQHTRGDTVLNYYASAYDKEKLDIIFLPTAAMLDFFESKSGVPYVQSSYSQILIGRHYQEMSGFAVLKESYGELVLKDSTETNLISHELSHQWWGNMITCENWKHFWLNEGIATFMSAAFNEHRFGKAKYESDINSYKKVYESIRKKGKDKPLVFDNWSNPTKEDRSLVYFKGAYVIHMLRKELGEEDFWKGLKSYSQKYFGQSVNTFDFQKVFEELSGRDLKQFFKRWVYEIEN